MPQSILRIVNSCAEYIPRKDVELMPRGVRGIYVLLKEVPARSLENNKYDVVYIGMSNSSVRRRIRGHAKSHRKGRKWTHFSVYRVFDNVTDQDILEIEGLLRAVYRKDSKANRLNLQKRHKRLTRIRTKDVRRL
jgi:hypothetical protein